MRKYFFLLTLVAAVAFNGQRVRLTGQYSSDTLFVSEIQAAP